MDSHANPATFRRSLGFRRARAWSSTIGAGAVLLLLGAAGGEWLHRILNNVSPVEIHSARFVESHARPGDEVTVKVDRTRNFACAGVAHQYWYDEDGAPYDGSSSLAGGTKLGRYISPFKKTVPANMPVGQACYAPLLEYRCETGVYRVRQPAACLQVVE